MSLVIHAGGIVHRTRRMHDDRAAAVVRPVFDRLQGNSFSVFTDCSSNSELEKLFTALSQDGKVTVPPSDMPFGWFGMCDDSFGISWILNCAKAG